MSMQVCEYQPSLPVFSHVSPPPAHLPRKNQTDRQNLEYLHNKGRKQTAVKRIKTESGMGEKMKGQE